MNSLTQMKTAPKIKWISIDVEDNLHTIQDLNWMCKLELKEI